MRLFFCFLLLLGCGAAAAQKINVLTSGTNTSIRGLSVVNDSVLWASGSRGMVAVSVNGGQSFAWKKVKGYEQRDFRDVEAFSASTAIIMAIAEPAVILKTTDGGNSWQKVFEVNTKGMFLDAMDFNGNFGVVIGDPLTNKPYLAATEDSGNHWHPVESEMKIDTGEAFFASSGTNIKLKIDTVERRYEYYAVSGGKFSNLLTNNNKYLLPLQQGEQSKGANSIALNPENNDMIVVGGDFTDDQDTTGNCVLISNGLSVHFSMPHTSPHGYRSCVTFLDKNTALACGTSGVDISTDGGKNWRLISTNSYHVCAKAKKGNSVFLAGKEGRISRLEVQD